MSELDERGLGLALERVEWLRLAYLFGSRARGDARADSDLDLGVVIGCPPGLEVYRTLANICSPWVAAEQLHVVILNEAPPLLCHRVLRDGRCLASRDEMSRVAWEVRVLQEYWDTARWRELDCPGSKRAPHVDADSFLATVKRAGELLRG